MKVALISLNQEKLPDVVIPIGLLSVKANVPERHETVLWDLCFEPDPAAYLAERIREFAPEVLALGLRNIQNNAYSDSRTSVLRAAKVIATLRELTEAPIVLGGSGFSVMPEALMQELKPDYGISGEGEVEFPKLLDAIESGARELGSIGNLLYFDEAGLHRTPPPDSFLDLTLVRGPDLSEADPRYLAGPGIANFQTKRGCPLKCSYCTYPRIEGKSKRLRPASRVVDEIVHAAERLHGMAHYFIVDSVFNHPPSHAKEFCRELIRREVKVPWTCYVNPRGFNQELADLMAEAGCAGMEIGSDSGVDRVLQRLGKGFTTKQILHASGCARSAGLKDCHTFILGTRGETPEEVGQTLDFIQALDPYCAILGIWAEDGDALDSASAQQRREFQAEIREVLIARRNQFPHWVMPALGVNFDERFFGFLRKRGIKGPLWQRIRDSA